MNQALLDPKNREDTLYYPIDHLNMTENNNIEEDADFIDRTITNKKKKCCEFRINRIDYGAFIVKDLSIFICIVFWFFFIATLVSVIIILSAGIKSMTIILSIFILIGPLSIGLFFGCTRNYYTYLLLESNSIILTKKFLCRKEIIIYNMGDLEKAEICYKAVPREEIDYYCFKLYFVRTSGEKEEFFRKLTPQDNVELKGIKYFIDLINIHIQKNMK